MKTSTDISTPLTTRRSRRRGLSLVEVMFCLVIGSMLLTSVAVAFRASLNSYKESQERGRLLNSSRQFMKWIVQDIRASDDATPYDINSATTTAIQSQYQSVIVPGYPTSGLAGSGVTGIRLLKTHADVRDPTASTANPIVVTYWFDTTQKQIFMTRQAGGTTATPAMICNYVQNLQIVMQPVTIPANPLLGQAAYVALQRAVVNVTLANKDANGNRIISDANQSLKLNLTDAAAPRKNYSGV